MIKTDTNGDTLWTKTFGGTVGNSVQQTYDGGYVITGVRTGDEWLAGDVWLIKTDANGDTLWTKDFGDSLWQYGNSVQQTTDGGYIIAGMIADGSGGRVWLIKVAPDVTVIDENQRFSIIDYYLLQNYPNPFNPSTSINFSLPQTEFTELKVYNILGKEISTLVSNKLNQGNHTYTFDGKNLASGVYYYEIVAGDYRDVKKMILLK
jgi:hypothetical protein